MSPDLKLYRRLKKESATAARVLAQEKARARRADPHEIPVYDGVVSEGRVLFGYAVIEPYQNNRSLYFSSSEDARSGVGRTVYTYNGSGNRPVGAVTMISYRDV